MTSPISSRLAQVEHDRFSRTMVAYQGHQCVSGIGYKNVFANSAFSRFLKSTGPSRVRGFTLVEILVVISIMTVLSLLVTAGLQSVIGSQYTNEISEIANTLVRARACAMANNTYVFVGIQEVDASQSSSGNQTSGVGRIGVTVVASNDGTRIYSTQAPGALPASGLTVVSPLRHYDNLHLATTASVNATLPDAGSTGIYNVATSTSLTTFNWPLNGTAQYSSFGSSPGTVIQFSPLGEAQIATGAYTDAILQWIELDFVPTHGTSTSGTSAKNPATILIDGASGAISTYRSS